MDDFKRRIVELANETRDHLTGDFAQVWEIVANNDLVVAVWQDVREPDGVGLLLIKGEDLLRQSVENTRAVSARTAAIPCIEYEQAVALRDETRKQGVGGMRGH